MRRNRIAATLALVSFTAANTRSNRGPAADGEPARLHYRVSFVSGGGVHRMEVWRDGDRRVKRVTDGALATYASHRPGDAGYDMTVLDLRRRISTRVSRDNLYRIGQFTDWFDLGHGLRHPKSEYRLAAAARAPTGLPRPVGPCAWYDLTQGARVTRICWSARVGVPMLIASADGRPVWRVGALDHDPFPPRLFVPDERGFVRDDADRDIERD